METVAPRVVPQGPTVSAPPPTAQISAPPPDLQRMEIGAKLEALVLQATSKGVSEITTTFGKLQISTTFPLPANASLQFQIIGKLPLLQLLITSVQGQSPQSFIRSALQASSPAGSTALSGNNAASTSTSQSSINRAAPAALTLTVGTNVIATKMGTAPLLGANPSAASATSVTVQGAPQTGATTTSPGLSGSPPPTGNQTTPTSSITASSPVAGQSSGVTPNDKSGLNQTGNRFSVRIVQVMPPSQLSSGGGLPPTGTSQFSVGQSVTGVVTSTSAQGHAVVQTHAGPVSLAAPNPLPPGTTLSFTINGPLPTTSSSHTAGWPNHSASVIMETHRWPELNDALRTLGETQPTLAQQVTNALLPKGDATLAANIILLLAAIRGGDIRNWFGDAPVRTLQRLRPDLMNRLRDDFVQMSRLADDTAGNDWRSYPVPFLNGSEIEQIRFFVKRKANEEEDVDDADQGSRFVIDLDLSHLGRMQLDGLVKTPKKQFDLIVRTDSPLQLEVQNSVRAIFQNAMDMTQHNGGLTFQAAPANFLNIQTKPTTSSDTGLIV